MVITWHSLFLLVHISAAIFLIGPHFALRLMISHMGKHPESAQTVYPLVEKVGRLPGIGGPLLLVTGLLMIAFGGGWAAFRELWVAVALALFVFGAIWIKVGIEPPFKRMIAAMQSGPIQPDEFKGIVGRVLAAINVESIWMVIVVILMILKPTL